jgi:hypothetical protein
LSLRISLWVGGQEWWFGERGHWKLDLIDESGKIVEKRYIGRDGDLNYYSAWTMVYEYLKNRNDWYHPSSIDIKP